jgi:menaquinone-dependent protoporphyrinogen oxidase
MHILVTYGSERGGTKGLAEMLGNALDDEGFDVQVAAAGDVVSLAGFDAVIVGGALYAGRWHKDARRFIKRHQQALRAVPVWLFSSGPLDDSAISEDIPPVRHAAHAASLVGARGHATFGGRLSPDAKGFPAASMAKTMSGDWRDPAQVRGWSKEIAEEMRASQGAER